MKTIRLPTEKMFECGAVGDAVVFRSSYLSKIRLCERDSVSSSGDWTNHMTYIFVFVIKRPLRY